VLESADKKENQGTIQAYRGTLEKKSALIINLTGSIAPSQPSRKICSTGKLCTFGRAFGDRSCSGNMRSSRKVRKARSKRALRQGTYTRGKGK